VVLSGSGWFDGLTQGEPGRQFPIDVVLGEVDAAGPGETHSLEGIRLRIMTRFGATIA
jgi:hypothetical protein